MSDRPWLKFYPRDWRGDQALRLVSLPARGLWIEMLCIMHEATPYGHLVVGAKPLEAGDLARLVGISVEEVRALLVELTDAEVLRKTRTGVIYSKRMTADHKRANEGRKAKVQALENVREKPGPSRVATRGPSSTPSTQRPEARVEVEGDKTPSTLYDGAAVRSSVPADVRAAFADGLSLEWERSYIAPCDWIEPTRTLVPVHELAASVIRRDARRVLAALSKAGQAITVDAKARAA